MPSGIYIALSKEEEEGLKKLRRSRVSGSYGERAHYVLLSSRGLSVKQIAQQLSRNPHTIRCWLKRYKSQGISGLYDLKGTGRPRHLREVTKEHLSQLLAHSPQAYGYQQSGWQVNLLLEQIIKEVSSVSEQTVVRALHELGWVYKRFSKTTPINSLSKSEKKEYMNEMLEKLKARQSDSASEVLFCDETHFSNEPYVQRGWFRRGKKEVGTQKKRVSKTLLGALSLETQKVYWKQSDRGNSTFFIQFLHQLHQSKPTKKLLLVLDNGSIHKSKKVHQFVKKHSWVELFYLPPYAPEYNPIERFWYWLKRKVYGAKGYRLIADLIRSIRKLIWHYNEKWLTQTIKFEFKVYKEIL